MAEENEDKFKAINQKLDDQVAEIFNLIYGKYIAGFAVCAYYKHDDDELTFSSSKDSSGILGGLFSGSAPLVASLKTNLIKSIEVYQKFYKKVISKSKTWKNRTAFAGIKKQQKIDSSSLNIADDKFASEDDKARFEESKKPILEIIDLLNKDEYSADKVGKLSNEKANEKLTNLANKLKAIKIKSLKEPIKMKAEEKTNDTNLPDETEKEGKETIQYAINLTKHLDDEDFDKKLAATEKEIEEGKNALSDWMQKDTDAANIIKKMVKPLGNNAGQMIPLVWVYGHLGDLRAMFESLLDQRELENLLTERLNARQKKKLNKKLEAKAAISENNPVETKPGEDNKPAEATENNTEKPAEEHKEQPTEEHEEQPNEFKEKAAHLVQSIDDILKKKKASEFAQAYADWVKAVNDLFSNLAAKSSDRAKNYLEKIKDDDPYKKICSISHILATIETEDKRPSQASDEEDVDSEGRTPDDRELEDSITAKNFLGSFRSYLNESVKHYK